MFKNAAAAPFPFLRLGFIPCPCLVPVQQEEGAVQGAGAALLWGAGGVRAVLGAWPLWGQSLQVPVPLQGLWG